MAGKRVPITLQINCGYSRVAIVELHKGQQRSTSDKAFISQKFQEIFSSNGYLEKPSNYWHNGSRSLFDKHLNYNLDSFSKAWQPTELRREYISTFSIGKWIDLPSEKQLLHTPNV